MISRAGLAAVLAVALPATLQAQAGSCELVASTGETQRNAETGTIVVPQPVVRCEGGVEISAAQGTYLQNAGEVLLNGNVAYRDPTRTLSAQNATYSSALGRLYATGNVVFTDAARGSTLRGPEMEYFRVQPGRPQPQVIATGRPHLTLLPDAQRPGTNRDPFDVDADRMVIVGEDQFTATGQVQIRRTDLNASGAEAQYDGTAGRMELRRDARVRSARFDLAGEFIETIMFGGEVQRVFARDSARLSADKLRVTGPQMQMFFANRLLERLVARGRGAEAGARPVASSAGFRLEADSLEAIMPTQKLDSVVAIGDARGEVFDTTAADTSAAGSAAQDWIEGDTIVGRFVQRVGQATGAAAAQDTAIELQRIAARGSARSLYRVKNEERPGRPGLNFVAASVIYLNFVEGELDTAQIAGLQRGLYLDPTPTAAARASSPAAPGAGP